MKEKAIYTLKDRIFKIIDCIFAWVKGYRFLFYIYFGAGVATFFLLMSQNLVNSNDGQKYNSVAYAGAWERSIGRWFWPFLDKIRLGIVSSPLNSIITFLLIAVGCIFLVDLFKVKRHLTQALVGCLLIATPLVCASLAYSYMSVTFGLAYLLAVISAYCAIKISKIIPAIIVGSIFLAWSMGCYQAYFSVLCLILLIYFIKLLFENEKGILIRNLLIKAIGTIVGGGILYEIIVIITNRIYNVEMTSYKGANTISFRSILSNLPSRIPEAFKEFYEFYFTNTLQKTYFGLKWIYILAFVIVFCFFIYLVCKIFKQKLLYGFLCIIAAICLPIACNATLLITADTNKIIMTGGLALLFPLLLCLSDEFMERTIVNGIYKVLLFVMLWINICIVNNDQVALLEGKNATVTIAENIVTQLINEDYLHTDTEITVIGRPSSNEMFACTPAWNRANNYAKYGESWSTDGNNNRRTWYGVFYNYCGISLNFCSDDEYFELLENDLVKEMPNFPEQGSICEVDGIVVIKVSDNYNY